MSHPGLHHTSKQPEMDDVLKKFWSCFSETQDPDKTNTIEMNHVFACRSKEDEVFPLTVKEIVEA